MMKYVRAVQNSIRFVTGRLKVGFVTAGAQKAGTSALDAYLRGHPEICMGDRKEIHFFDRDFLFRYNWIPNKLFYHAYFSVTLEHKIIGEVTPIYMYWDLCAHRMWKYNPEMKIIIVLRNPVERAYSHWNMEKQRGYEKLSFFEAINAEENRLRLSPTGKDRVYSYLDRGFYSCQIRRIWRYFPKEQTLFIKHDELRNNPREIMKRLWRFLCVSDREVNDITVHARSYESTIEEKECKLLKEIYRSEIYQIESMLKWDCSDWLT